MATRTLTTNYLSRLSNANHDGVSQQIRSLDKKARYFNMP